MKKYIRAFLWGTFLSVLPFVVVVVIAYSGVAYICSLTEGKANEEGVEIDISSMSAEKLLEVIKDKNKVSSDTIENFCMKRKSIVNILKYVCNYNNYKGRKEEAHIYLEMFKQWRAEESVKNPYYEEELASLGEGEDSSSIPMYITLLSEHNEYIAQPHTVSNRWLTDKYKMDWQILYVFCLYQALDEDSSGEEDIDEEELADDIDSLGDIGDEDDDISLVTVKKKKIDEIGKMVEPSYNYTWNAVEALKGHAFSFNPASIGGIDYGYPIDMEVSDSSCYDGFYSLTGKIPTSNIDTVQLLTRKDYYEMAADGTTCKLIRTEYNAERLYALLEAYGGERDLEIFLTSLEEMPQGKELVNRLKYDIEHEGEVIVY